MRVLHFLPVYLPAWQYGGPIFSVSRLCQGLVQHGIDVRVITTNSGLRDFPSAKLGCTQIVNGVEVIYYPVDSHNGHIRSNALVEALPVHMEWADLLHLSSIWQPLGLPVQQRAHAAGIPVIQTLRGALGPYSWRRGWWKKIPYFLAKERPVLQKASALHCTTLQESREIKWLQLAPPHWIFPNPLDLTTFKRDDSFKLKWRTALKIKSDQKVFLVAGRMHHKKGLDLLPGVLHELRSKDWSIIFAGNDEDSTLRSIRRKIFQLGLYDRCFWLDTLPPNQLSELYSAVDCLLLPSRHENFGNVVVEAISCGCKVIASDKVGSTEFFDRCPAVTVLPRSKKEWTNALLAEIDALKTNNQIAPQITEYFSSISVSMQALKMYNHVLDHF